MSHSAVELFAIYGKNLVTFLQPSIPENKSKE